MTENLEQFSQTDEAGEKQNEAVLPMQTVILEIPSDLVTVLQQHSQHSGQTQTKILLSLLRSMSELGSESLLEAIPEQSASQALTQEQQKIRSLEARIDQLEALLHRLELLEGKWSAF